MPPVPADGRHVDCADPLQHLHIDRAGETGLQAVDAAAVVDPGSLRFGYGRDARAETVEGLVRVAGELLGASLHPQQVSQQPVHLRRLVESAVEKHVRDLGLILHVVGERDVGGADAADIDDQVRLELQHILQVGGVPAPREPAVFGQVAHALQQECLLGRARRSHPADHLLRRQGIEQDRRGRSGGQDTRYPLGKLDAASGRVGDGAGRLLRGRGAP